MFPLLMLLSVLPMAFATESPTLASCPSNEIFYNASVSPACDVNCQDLDRRCPILTGSGSAGCYCRPGFARNLSQQCVPQDECKNDCFPNERPIAPERGDCENSCSSGEPSVCYSVMERRCVCEKAFCRDCRGRCVKPTNEILLKL